MKFNEFVNYIKSVGGVDTDGYYGKQCMDLYNYYCNNVLGLQNVGADCAKNILNNKYVMENFERIDNYLEFVPKKGDVAVFTGGRYGHVAICLGEGDINTFKTLDQNWKPQQLTEEIHNYTYMAPLVFLRPKNQENIIEEQPKQEVVNNKYKIGDRVIFSTCYSSSTDTTDKAIPANKMLRNYGTITKIVNARNPYLLDDGLCWVNDGDIRGYAENPITYTVQVGDTLSAIGQKFGKDYREIAAKNGITNPDYIQVGQVLKI